MSARDAAIPLRHMRDAARRAIEIAQPTLARPPRLRVEVLHGPEVAMQAVLFLDGDPIGLMFLDEGPVSALAAGDYEVSLWGDAADEVQRQRVRVADAGETRVVFDLAARR